MTFKIPNMSADELYAWLESLYACDAALEWVKGKDLREANATCPNIAWITWLVDEADGAHGFPALDEYLQAMKLVHDVYLQVRELAWGAYLQMTNPFRNLYWQTAQVARDAYLQAVKDLFEVED